MNGRVMSKWIYRPSIFHPDHGIYFRHVQSECPHHGMAEHIEIKPELECTTSISSKICRKCCVEKACSKKPEQANYPPQNINSRFSNKRF